MSNFVYILQSDTTGRYYVGQTENLDQRFSRHNQGKVPSTKHGVPWKMVRAIPMENRTEALKLEKKIKKRGIERYLKENFGV